MTIIKGIIILILLLVVFPMVTRAQEVVVNVEIESTHEAVDQHLNGPLTKEGLEKLPYKIWFNTNYKTYLVDSKTLQKIKRKKLRDLKILAFMGTWCHDSNREIPRLIRIVEELGIADQLELHGLDVDKTSRTGRESKYNIKKTPTIIFLKDGKEITRILEQPDVSFEQTLFDILK